MKIEYGTNEQKIFGEILENLVGKKLKCDDSSGMPDFVLKKHSVELMAENLAEWFSEEYPEIDLTNQYAKEYVDKTYPLV